MDVREKLEVIAHLGDHISYKEDIGICYDSALAKVVEDAYMTLKNGVTVQQWISVKDRLPGLCDDVLLYFEDDDNMVAGYLDDVDEDRSHWVAYSDGGYYTDCDYEPTHWMPLPQPPKGE